MISLSDGAEGPTHTTGVWFILTWSPWYGDVSPVEGRSLLMSWAITLNVGLSVGSNLQQCVISWYLRGKVSIRFIRTLLPFKKCLSVFSHLCWSEVWLIHVAAIFDHLVKVGIHNNVWVGALTCMGRHTHKGKRHQWQVLECIAVRSIQSSFRLCCWADHLWIQRLFCQFWCRNWR